MSNYRLDYSEPENERDNPHDVSLEHLDEIIYGGKPSALPTVTWDELDVFEQYALELLSKGETLLTPNYRTTYDRLLGMGLVTLIPAELTTFPYDGKELQITPAGRAILPMDALAIERALADASVEAHAETLARVKVLEAENARLRAGIQAVLDNGLEHWASGDWYVQDEKSGKMWNGVREAAAGLKELLGK